MAFGLTNEFTMIILFVALACLFAANDAVKETLSRGLMYNDDRLIYDVIKRLGSSNYNYQSEDPKDSGSVSGQQFAHDERQNVQATCEPIIQQGSIIKTTESINAGADYIDSVKNVKSNAECLDYCCQNRTCDVAVYQDKDDHYCYLFRCAGQCIFKAHSGYLVSKIKSRKSEHSEEELQNLSSDLAHVAAGEEKKTMDGAAPDVQEKPENVQHVSEQTTQASATTQSESPELVIAPHSVGLGGFCMLSKQCEDPNAVCGRGNCICREDFYNKEGLCRKVCQQLEFECFELGSLTRGPDCIPRSQVCDSYLNCADGTDEINCDSMAANNQQNSWSQQHAGSASSSVKEGSKDGNAADPYTESVVQEAAKDTYQQQDHLQRIDTQNYGQSQAAKEQQHLVSADQQLNMPKPPPPPPPAPKKPDVRPKPIPTQHALAGSEGSMHVNQNLYSDFPSGVRPPALNDLQKVPGKAPRPTSVAEKIADAANVAHSDNAHDLEPKPHSTKSPPATTASTSKITSAAAASPSPATQKMFPESHGEKKHVFLSSEKVIIASTRTDAEGPIIALSLGLAFTVILLVLVGCRLRNVRHRLRKGRPLHQNEADYLINGMYL